jgi:Ca2+-transporting ATPase
MTVKPLSRPPATATETIVQTGVGHPNGATDRPHAASAVELAQGLRTDLDRGLGGQEAALRLARYGSNRPERVRRPPYVRLALNQLLDPLVALLVAAAAISIAIGETTEGIAIAAIIVLNGALGFWQEAAAERAILALSEGFTQAAVVVREGVERQVAAEDVVPGDVLIVAAGERVAADARLVETTSLEVDESALTGEWLPVAKEIEPTALAAPLAERTSMIFAGTGVTQGAGRALVVGTGPRTVMGAIERLAAEAKTPPTPLTRRLGRLAREMVVAGVLITVALGGVMLARGEGWSDAFLIAVALAVAAVPEGLAATVTAALAFGARAMAARGAIVRRLAAIEALGETSVICTDKTGTLTENQIRVAAIRPTSKVTEEQLLEAAVLASSAHRVGDELLGDPIETALLTAAMERGLVAGDLRRRYHRVHEIPFSSERKRMTVVYEDGPGRRAVSKGGFEIVAELAAVAPPELLETADAWAAEGLRVLAVATRELGEFEDPTSDEIEHDFRLLGVIAMHDPLRPSAEPAVVAARTAGIRVQMVTGDHPATARTIGHALGLADHEVLARATPADKLALVEELQACGEVVAVTGDGVNDAPALRRADVGIAMGRTGTEAAREAAAIVLTDDDFATIVAAVGEGRRIGDNIRKFVAFLLSANLGEVLVFAIAITAGLGAPLAVIQVLLVNLVTDGLPALALARDPAGKETMSTPPRVGSALFDGRTWRMLLAVGALVGCTTFAAFAIGRALGGGVAQTMAFATLALAELALVYGMRSPTAAAWEGPRNRWLDLSVAASIGLVAGIVLLPQAHEPFATVSLEVWQALLIVPFALVPLVGLELLKATRRRRLARLARPSS